VEFWAQSRFLISKNRSGKWLFRLKRKLSLFEGTALLLYQMAFIQLAASMVISIWILYQGKNWFRTHSLTFYNAFRFDYTTHKWTSLAPMSTPRASFTAVVSSNYSHIYVMGGTNSNCVAGTGLNLVERYDLIGNCWETLTPMKHKRHSHTACLTNM
jgi:hypothetical protein